MSNKEKNILAFSHYNEGINRIFEDYCNGIRENSKNYHYIDYIKLFVENGKSGGEQKILALIEKEKIDIIVFVWWSCDLSFDPDFLAALKKRCKIVMNFYDTEYYFEGVDRYYAQHADLVMLPDFLAGYRYKLLNIPVITTFSLFDKENYVQRADVKKDIGVSFVGGINTGNRKQMLERLESENIKVQAYGAGTEAGFVSFDDMVNIFNRSKISLNFTATSSVEDHTIPLPRINQRIKQAKGRPIEVALTGGFVLSEYAPGIEEMFVLGEEIETFKTPEEMIEKIRYYLGHDEERERIAAKGCQRARRDYGMKEGFSRVLKKLASQPETLSYPTYYDSQFWDNYQAFRFFYVAIFLLNGKFLFFLEEIYKVVSKPRLVLSRNYFFFIRGMLHWLREHPCAERFCKKVKQTLRLKVKY